MTEIQPYIPPTDSWVAVIEPVGDLASKIAGTDFVPKDFRGKPAAVAGAILFGRELGLPPMTTLKNTYVVHGTPDLSAEAQRALVLAAGHEIEFEEVTATRCKMRGRRVGSEVWTQAQYTMDEAKQSGDFSKNANYKSRPQEMLIARCTSRLCSMTFPDVTGGFSSAVNVPLVQSEDDTAPASEQPKVTVHQEPKKAPARRKPKAEPKAEPKQPEPAQESSEPPLPGEEGYEEFNSAETGEILDAEVVEEAPELPTLEEPDTRQPLTADQSHRITVALKALELGKVDGLALYSEVCGRPVKATRDLSRTEAGLVLAHLETLTDA